MRMAGLLLAFCACAALGACNGEVSQYELVPCGDGGVCYAYPYPFSGQATLAPHTSDADYPGSVVSFEHATTVDHGEVNGDWDLSVEGAGLLLRVNTVTDDQSWIVDLGAISLLDVPETVAEPEAGDELPARVEHVYLVRTADSDTLQYAAIRVLSAGSAGVTLQWFRSREPDRFAFPRGEAL